MYLGDAMTRGPIIRSPKAILPDIARMLPSAVTHTAINGGSDMILKELWIHTTADDTNVWTVAATGTGTTAVSAAGDGKVHRLFSGGALDDVARTISRPYAPNVLSITNASEMYTKVIAEWMMQFVEPTDENNAAFLAGFLAQNAGGTDRSSTNALGFILASDALNTLSDKAGTETVTVATGAPSLTEWNTYRITMTNGNIAFAVNGVTLVNNTTNLPLKPLQFTIVNKQEAAGTAGVRLGPVAIWAER